jgi:D-alanyl-D-alanine carboxypeptidase/D-alanyl-D-alanine-endopeptidase (penicillin-binding protein 4)
MRGTPAAGACRGKTGTIDGVSTLAGYCTPSGGVPVAFAVMMSGVRLDRARTAQDRLVAALASI